MRFGRAIQLSIKVMWFFESRNDILTPEPVDKVVVPVRFEHVARIFNIVLGVVNIALFCLWFSLIRKDSVVENSEASAYILNQVSMQVTALGAMIAAGALLLAGLGLFGFQVVMERAENKAEEAARSNVAAKWDQFVKQRGLVVQVNAGPAGPVPQAEDAKEVEGGL